jgi:hypothetical protein
LEELEPAPVQKTENTAVGVRCAGHATRLYPQKFAHTSPTIDGLSVDIVRSRTKARELSSMLVVFIKFQSKEFNGVQSYSDY